MSKLTVCPLLPGGRALCDCVIRTEDGKQFYSQRCFLRTVSPFFEAALSMERGADSAISIRGIASSVLEALLTFYYTDQLLIADGNVLQLLEAADMLLMSAARDKCFDWLLKRINWRNCLDMAALADWYYCPKFQDAVLAFLLEHFDEVWRRNKQFPRVPAALLKKLLCCEELNVRKEADLLYAIERWCTSPGQADNGEAVLSALLQCVRVGFCENAELDQIRQCCPALAKSDAFKVSVTDAMERGCCKCQEVTPKALESTGDLQGLPKQDFGACSKCGGASRRRWEPRLPYEVIVLVGSSGFLQEHAAFEAYDARAKCWWTNNNKDFQRREQHGVALLGHRLYVLGGRTAQSEAIREVDSFDFERCVWERVAPLNVIRRYVSVVVLGGYIYAIGGHTGRVATATVERYNPTKNQWTMVAPMKRKRWAAGACTFKGKLYVSGGAGNKTVFRSVEEYAPSLDCWSVACRLPCPRHYHRMVCYAGRLYVIGGRDGATACKSVFRSQKDFRQGWQNAAPMELSHYAFAVAELEGELYVISGSYDGGGGSNIVERYSSKTNRWERAVGTKKILINAAACTVKSLAVARLFADSARNQTQAPAIETSSSESSDPEEDP